MEEKMKKSSEFFMKHGRYLIPAAIYTIIYIVWFRHLEAVNVGPRLHVIHTIADDYIPFCEYFVVPYFMWFFYVFIVMACLFLKNKNDFLKGCTFLFTGMTVFLIVSTVWPNVQQLRPAVMPRSNMFTRMVAALYAMDTPTNVCPSIHVYNSIGCNIAVHNNSWFRKHRGICAGSTILSTLIILSTMFIKQHSLIDVTTAIAMALAMYIVVYRFDLLVVWKRVYNERKQRKTGSEII
jgi:membrane-associated phospholipid phosphatase